MQADTLVASNKFIITHCKCAPLLHFPSTRDTSLSVQLCGRTRIGAGGITDRYNGRKSRAGKVAMRGYDYPAYNPYQETVSFSQDIKMTKFYIGLDTKEVNWSMLSLLLQAWCS